MQTRHLRVLDMPTQICTLGEGQPQLLLLHGWRSESAVFTQLMQTLWEREGLVSVAVDLPGFGGTPAPLRPWTIFDYADFVAALVDQLGLEQVDILGHSFGGRIGIVLASRQVSWLRRLVLTGAAGVRRPSLLRDAKQLVAKLVKPFFLLPGTAGLRKKIYQKMGAEDYVATPELQQTFVNVVTEDLTRLFPDVTQQTLLLWGGRDDAAPLSFARDMQRSMAETELVVFPRAGHFAFLDEPALAASRIARFLTT